MSRKMLIDARHPEETRVAIQSNGKVEDFDFESASRKALRGNIYLARVTRVEPSLQAAFVEYGGNRHGFLAFSEIHPDYYQIPVADRDVLRAADALEAELAEKLAELDSDSLVDASPDPDDDDDNDSDDDARVQSSAGDDDEGETRNPRTRRRRTRRRRRSKSDEVEASSDDASAQDDASTDDAPEAKAADDETSAEATYEASSNDAPAEKSDSDGDDGTDGEDSDPKTMGLEDPEPEVSQDLEPISADEASDEAPQDAPTSSKIEDDAEADTKDAEKAEEVKADADTPSDDDAQVDHDAAAEDDAKADVEEEPAPVEKTEEQIEAERLAAEQAAEIATLRQRYDEARREREKLIRNYRIQEVIKRRQIMLVQVVKEERGNKGAALTSFLSLAGRYGVLMPNNARGGGVSRKITNSSDRKRLRKAIAELDVPKGQGLIIRTAGGKRTKAEIKRDYDYLSRLWDTIREHTMHSVAPCLIYEEASLIKRAIRDLYDKDMSEITVEGEDGYREAKDFMKMLMPSHAKHVQPYKERMPLFLKHDVERQLDEMYQPVVNLKSGGYLVIQQTEALISIDVNSGKSTKERSVEATALKTNSEAAVEVARQCRLRDLAGLLVIDFIDMDENRNNRTVEKKLKEALKTDRARIQVGNISGFGLMEMSRQRRRSGIVDGTTRACPTCDGAGAVRSVEMAALRILRAAEEAAAKDRPAVITIQTSHEVALYVLNQKRSWLNTMEAAYGSLVEVQSDQNKAGDQYEITKRGKAVEPEADDQAPVAPTTIDPDKLGNDAEGETNGDKEIAAKSNTTDDGEDDKPKRKRRRRRRGKSDDADADSSSSDDTKSEEGDKAEGDDKAEGKSDPAETDDVELDEDGKPKKRRRRGRRGGKRNRKPGDQDTDNAASDADNGASTENDAPADHIELPAVAAAVTAAPPAPTPTPETMTPEDLPAKDIPDVPEAPAVATAVTEEPAADKPPAKKKPKRAGWWSKAMGKN